MPEYRALKNIIEWKRTTGQFVAILEAVDRFEPGTIREIKRHGPETVLGGMLRGTTNIEWYALAYNRNDLEWDEARALARETLDKYRNGEV
ncbi:MAG TPA: hypothetical protein VMP10_03725 [Chloroflexota bacterium]|nr:hypothetical protein [Chloroflexota bacterium]